MEQQISRPKGITVPRVVALLPVIVGLYPSFYSLFLPITINLSFKLKMLLIMLATAATALLQEELEFLENTLKNESKPETSGIEFLGRFLFIPHEENLLNSLEALTTIGTIRIQENLT